MPSVLMLLRHAGRRLRRSPVFAAAAVITLALGIGATTAVYSLIDAVLLRPLPYPDPAQLVDLTHSVALSGMTIIDQSDATFLYYRQASHAFTDVAAYRETPLQIGALSGARGDADRPERVNGARVSASTFGVLAVRPLRGRAIADRDDHPDAPPVAVIGERLWQRKYGGDSSIVGKRLDVDGVAREVIGVMPESFRFPSTTTDVWIPTAFDPARTASAAFEYRGLARLRPGVTIDAARADLQRLLPHVPEAFPGRLTVDGIKGIDMRAVVRPLRDVVVGDVARVLWVVFGAVAVVLLIACANVANLFLVRAEGRQHELAVKRALGAGRAAIGAELLSEAVIVAAVGGALGIGAAAVGVRALRTLGDGINIPRLAEVGVDGATLAVALGITALAVFVVSGFPALRWARHADVGALTDNGRNATAGRSRQRARNVLVTVQVALALVLLAGAGLMARSFASLTAVQPGFDPAHTYTFRVALLNTTYPKATDATRFLTSALDAIARTPGVRAVGVATKLPLDPAGRSDTALFVQDHPLAAGKIPNIHQAVYASPDYFRAIGIPLVEGRSFGSVDVADARNEVVVSRALALRYWPTGSALGKQVRAAPFGPYYTIVGVAGDVRGTGLEQPADETIYFPLVVAPLGNDTARWSPRDVAFVVRGAASASLIALPAQAAVRGLDPSIPPFDAHAMTDLVSRAEATTRITLVLLGLASAIALVLGAVGIYGVVSYAVSLRTREIAVRIALGADPAGIRRMISRQALSVAMVGVLGGVAGALLVTRALAALLVGVSPIDPPTLAIAALLLLGVALGASWLPARRAAGVDPAQTLRAE
ncbi:MAG: ABC transporter permease [Gemmatimonadales bacterium]